MKNIEEQVTEAVQKIAGELGSDKKLEELEQANRNFKILVEKGIVKHRGYNLLAIEDGHLNRLFFNSK